MSEWIKVESKNIAEVSFRPDPGSEPLTGDLLIFFRSGITYKYSNVPDAVFKDFLAADSQGSFHHKYIKPRFGFEIVPKD